MTSELGQALPTAQVRVSSAEDGEEGSAPVVEDIRPSQSGATTGVTAEEYAASFQTALTVADYNSPRSAQHDDGILGASEAGGCRQRAVYTVRQTPPSDVVKKGKARIGSALHKVFLDAVGELFPERIIECELTVTLPSGRTLLLHPDEIDPVHDTVVDYKFKADLAYTRSTGVSDQQRIQTALQGLAAVQAGLVKADGLLVGNHFVSMTDSDDTWTVLEPFDMTWVERADDWFTDVQYALDHGEDAGRDAPFYICRDYCPFLSLCRPPLEDAMGELHSAGLREAVLTVHEAVRQRKHWAEIEKQGKTLLAGVSGRVNDISVSSTWVNSGKGYYKVETREVP